MNKKGISPLIATVLIIGFTVALAAIIITWGSGFVNKLISDDALGNSDIDCLGIELEITDAVFLPGALGPSGDKLTVHVLRNPSITGLGSDDFKIVKMIFFVKDNRLPNDIIVNDLDGISTETFDLTGDNILGVDIEDKNELRMAPIIRTESGNEVICGNLDIEPFPIVELAGP